MIGAVVAIGLIITGAMLFFAGAEYVSAQEIDRHARTRLRNELSRQPVEPWTLHDQVTVVPKDDQ